MPVSGSVSERALAAFTSLGRSGRSPRSATFAPNAGNAAQVAHCMPILVEALTAMRVMVTSQTEDRLTGTSEWGAVTFQKVGDLFLGRVDGKNEEATQSMLAALDTQVGHIAQQRTAAIVMERAKSLGFRLIEERDEDGALNYVFEEETA